MTYDAILYVSFGGPEGMEDVMPYLENVLRGRRVPEVRKQEVARHYEAFGGISPINRQNRQVIDALGPLLEELGLSLPIYFGNRNWNPLLPATMRQMASDGVQRALAFVTSAYSSYSGCRQYRENISSAREEAGDAAPRVDKIRVFYNHPLFIEANAERLRDALGEVPESMRDDAAILFTAHSLPAEMAAVSNYEAQLRETCRLVAGQSCAGSWKLVFQSRSGSPSQPWLEPDVCGEIARLAGDGARQIVLAPVGFLSDHMEVLHDLDVEAADTAKSHGVSLVRSQTVGCHPAYLRMIAALIEERVRPGGDRPALGERGAGPHRCPAGCCPKGR